MRKSEYDNIREAEFREEARAIVQKDRHARKYGHSVDTAGAIKRAMEKAYQRGRREEADGEPVLFTPKRPLAIFWDVIPPKARKPFCWICLFICGEDIQNTNVKRHGIVKENREQRATASWQFYLEVEGGIAPMDNYLWSNAHISPLCKLGLLAVVKEEPTILQITAKGLDTWWEAVETLKRSGLGSMGARVLSM